MIINHNLPGSNAIRQMNTNSATASKSMQKLSSGLRINSASDDAAGLAISEKMRGQIRGLDQASSNAQDGISLTQTAEGALSETTSILQRMRELGVQSATDTNTADDRAKIQSETDELAKEITRISNTTEFNSQNLLNGGVQSGNTGELTFHIGANSGQNLSLSIKAMDAKTLGVSRDALNGTIGANNAGLSSVEADNGINASDKLAAGTYNVKVAGVSAGATSATTSSIAGAIASGATSGTATADTSVTLTYSTGAGTAAKGTGNSVTIVSGAVTGTASAATSVTLTRTAGAPAVAGTITGGASDDTKSLSGVNSGTSVKVTIDSVDYTINNATLKAIDGTAGDESALKTALEGADDGSSNALSSVADVTYSNGKFTITSKSTGTASNVTFAITDGSGGADKTAIETAFGITDAATDTGSVAGASTWVATGDATGTKGDSASFTVNGLTVDMSKLASSVDGDVVTITGKEAGWTASGDKTGTISGATNAINGMNIDITKLSGFSNGETVTVTGTKDASTTVQLFDDSATSIGNAIKIDKANGGTYKVGDSATGKMSVTFEAGEAQIGTSTVKVSQSESTATTFSDGQKSVDASVSGGIDVSTQDSANLAITKIDTAIKTVSSERAKLGAYSNRLEHTIANLGTSSENLTSAESRIRDVDMAKEMATFSKNNILSQAAQAMLAQANQQPQQVLQLLR